MITRKIILNFDQTDNFSSSEIFNQADAFLNIWYKMIGPVLKEELDSNNAVLYVDLTIMEIIVNAPDELMEKINQILSTS